MRHIYRTIYDENSVAWNLQNFITEKNRRHSSILDRRRSRLSQQLFSADEFTRNIFVLRVYKNNILHWISYASGSRFLVIVSHWAVYPKEKGKKNDTTTTFKRCLYGATTRTILMKNMRIWEVNSWRMNPAAIFATARFTPYWYCAETAFYYQWIRVQRNLGHIITTTDS